MTKSQKVGLLDILERSAFTERDLKQIISRTQINPLNIFWGSNYDSLYSEILNETKKLNCAAPLAESILISFPPAENRLIELGFLNNPSIMNSSQKELYNRFKTAVTTDSVTNELACDALNLLDSLIQRSQDSDKKHLKAQAQLTDMAIIIHQLRDISVRINDLPKS